MTPEDITGDNEENHPEVREDVEATLPASEKIKTDILDAIKGRVAESRELAYDDEIHKGKSLLTADGKPLNLLLYLKSKDDFVAIVTLVAEKFADRSSRIINYHIKNSPDGLQFEKLQHHQPPFSPLPENREAALAHIEESLERVDRMEAATRDERELGLTFFSEKDAQECLDLINNARPRPDSV